MIFKIGDRVTSLHDCSVGQVGNIVDIHKIGSEPAYIVEGFTSGSPHWDGNHIYLEKYLELTNKNTMQNNIKEKFVTAFLPEPEKTFRRAGITNGDGFLTTDGQSIFLGFLLNKYGKEFKTAVVDDLIKEDKE